MESREPSQRDGEKEGGVEHRVGFARALLPLAETVLRQLPERSLAEAVLELVRERAPDEQLALAFLTKLLEQAPAETTEFLREPRCASDLIFCLGASELIGTGLVKLGNRWVSAFENARTTSASDLADSIRFRVPPSEDTAQMTQQ